jgi:hypothetical protein
MENTNTKNKPFLKPVTIISIFLGLMLIGIVIGTLMYSQSPERYEGQQFTLPQMQKLKQPGFAPFATRPEICPAIKGLTENIESSPAYNSKRGECVCDSTKNFMENPDNPSPDADTGMLYLEKFENPCVCKPGYFLSEDKTECTRPICPDDQYIPMDVTATGVDDCVDIPYCDPNLTEGDLRGIINYARRSPFTSSTTRNYLNSNDINVIKEDKCISAVTGLAPVTVVLPETTKEETPQSCPAENMDKNCKCADGYYFIPDATDSNKVLTLKLRTLCKPISCDMKQSDIDLILNNIVNISLKIRMILLKIIIRRKLAGMQKIV